MRVDIVGHYPWGRRRERLSEIFKRFHDLPVSMSMCKGFPVAGSGRQEDNNFCMEIMMTSETVVQG